ncbi:MAG: dual specificity protein phosphatase family protein [Steroidobacteraceae bacterium]
MNRPLPNSYWVLPGSLLAGEYPHADDPVPERASLGLLLRAGIDAFIDLTHPGERPEYQSLLPADVRYLRRPITDMSVPRQPDEMRVIQMHLQALLAGGRRVYVHCRAGIGRTGTVIGCFLAERGVDGVEALRQLNQLWRQSERSASWVSVPQTPEQTEYVLRWADQQRSGPRAPLGTR